MDIPDFKTCKMIKIEFNKQIMDRCDSKIDFREAGKIKKERRELTMQTPRICGSAASLW